MWADSHRGLDVYQRAFDLAMRVFELTRPFSSGEKFSMADQIRRSWRSACANLAEAWAKRRYEAPFICKLTDCIGEAGETQTWPDFAFTCKYMGHATFKGLCDEYHRLIHSLNSIISHAGKWCKK